MPLNELSEFGRISRFAYHVGPFGVGLMLDAYGLAPSITIINESALASGKGLSNVAQFLAGIIVATSK